MGVRVWQSGSRFALRGILVLVSVVSLASVGWGDPLNLPQLPPDITSGGITISYDAGTGEFTANGTALEVIGGPSISSGEFALSADVDSSGVMDPSAATLTIRGEISPDPLTDLLTADLDRFGFVPDGSVDPPLFEFEGEVTGGSLAADYGGLGAPVGVTLSADSPDFQGNFTVDYTSNPAVTVSDVFATPEPTVVALVVLTGLACAWRRPRHRAG